MAVPARHRAHGGNLEVGQLVEVANSCQVRSGPVRAGALPSNPRAPAAPGPTVPAPVGSDARGLHLARATWR